MTSAHASPWWRPRTLSRQLIYGVSALVTVVVLGIGALSLYNLHTYVAAESDTEVSHSMAAFERSYAKLRAEPAVGTDPLGEFTGQAPGTLIAVLKQGRVVDTAVFSDGETVKAPTAATASIESQVWTQSTPRTIELRQLGKYRAISTDVGGGETLVSAVSLQSADELVASKTIGVVAMTGAAAALAAIGTLVLLRWALRPLRRVAATAAKAASLPLADEHHRITARVRHADSNPDNEVGIVGETLNRLLANVDSALAARAASDLRMRRFLTDASHELRTPLAAIRGYAELTRQESGVLPPMTEYALARIESESHRMTALVSDMLLLSRLDEGQALDVRRIDLGALVSDAVNDAAVSAPDHRWLTDLPEDPVWISGDEARLTQVVGNLLANVKLHTPVGVTVTTRLRSLSARPVPQVQLTVTDDGPGIDPEILPTLFHRFVRGNASRVGEATGTGLGLAIVASIAEAHGGKVTAHSSGDGTELRVELPVVTP